MKISDLSASTMPKTIRFTSNFIFKTALFIPTAISTLLSPNYSLASHYKLVEKYQNYREVILALF
eukprot:UN16271